MIHGMGWPSLKHGYSGMFIYNTNDHQLHIGNILGLGYKNPYVNPYLEFQVCFKQSFFFRSVFPLCVWLYVFIFHTKQHKQTKFKLKPQRFCS